jgi:hypothetical protein
MVMLKFSKEGRNQFSCFFHVWYWVGESSDKKLGLCDLHVFGSFGEKEIKACFRKNLF